MTSTSATTDTVVLGDVQTQATITVTDEIIIGDGRIGPSTSTNKSSAANQDIADTRLTFPRDFPKAPPEGVTILSFAAFKERGICVEPRAGDPEELEVDGLGIPTIAMRTTHASDKCKTKTRRTKLKQEKAKEAKLKYLDRGIPIPFWEQWDENESLRIAKPTNQSDSRMTKFVAAATDFKTGRPWPPLTNSQIDPSHLWTMMKVFMGIEGIPKKKDRPSRKKVFKEAFSDDEDDDSDSDMEVDFVDEDSDSETPAVGDPKQRKAFHFLNDPEKMVKIFLSSYIRMKGIVWSKINLEQTPHLVKFFLEFLIRSRTLPRSEAGLRAAVEVTKQALRELPLTSELSSVMPDDLSKGFRECFGTQTEVFRTLEVDDDWLKQLRANDEAVAAKQRKAIEAAAAAASIVDVDVEGEAVVISETPQEVSAPADEIVPHSAQNGGWGVSTQEAGVGGWAAPAAGDTSTGWGVSTGEWGTEANVWSMEALDKVAEDDYDNPWATTAEEKSSLMSLLGPTVLPLTHTTGLVEQSLRRITELIPIPSNIPPKTVVSEDDPYVADPAGVEFDLERKLPKVVLSPWLNWDGGEMPAYSEPRMLQSSKGEAVEPPYITKTEGKDDSLPAAAATPKPHDPASDSITVLVHPDVFEKLAKGMCFAGTWVQIVRQPVEPGSAAPAKKRKKGKKKGPANFWYMDELAGVFPSFWTAK